VLGQVFLWVGVGFAAFASLMMFNFIVTSINYKKREIGILRAIGSRSNDVFSIFFSESFVIAMINFVLSAGISFGVTMLINNLLREEYGLLMTILSFGVMNIIYIFAISLGVAFIASFMPVRKIAAKKPIDAIRDR
jgi:ABC-type antimicrobial peptide transport system permease subunit